MEKQCSKCKAAFNCQNESRGCWCEGVQLSQHTLTLLREQYENCLCPACLKSFEDIRENGHHLEGVPNRTGCKPGLIHNKS